MCIHTRRTIGAFLIPVFLAFTSGRTIAADHLPKDIAARLATKWLSDAKQIRTPEHVIYYQGSATGGAAPDGKHWVGVIAGEILVLTPTMATACPMVHLGQTGSISVKGPSQGKLVAEPPPWKELLKQSK